MNEQIKITYSGGKLLWYFKGDWWQTPLADARAIRFRPLSNGVLVLSAPPKTSPVQTGVYGFSPTNQPIKVGAKQLGLRFNPDTIRPVQMPVHWEVVSENGIEAIRVHLFEHFTCGHPVSPTQRVRRQSPQGNGSAGEPTDDTLKQAVALLNNSVHAGVLQLSLDDDGLQAWRVTRKKLV